MTDYHSQLDTAIERELSHQLQEELNKISHWLRQLTEGKRPTHPCLTSRLS